MRKGSGNTEFTLYGNKTIVNYAAVLYSVTIGTRLFQKQAVRVSSSPLPLQGNKFLMQFDEVIIDWKKHHIYLPYEYLKEEPLKTLGFDPLFVDGKGLYAGALLSQIGEFSFVLMTVAREMGLVSDRMHQVILSVIALSMALSAASIKTIHKFIFRSP